MPRTLLLALVFIIGAGVVARPAEKNDPDAVSLSGIVTQPSGAAATEAEVWLVTSSMRGEPLVYDHVRSDSEGKFRLTLPGRWMNDSLRMRRDLGVVAYHSGWAPAVVGFSRNHFPRESGLKVELKPNVASKVRIVAPDGSAVRGAKVRIEALACDAIRAESLHDEPGLSLAPNIKMESAKDRAALQLSPEQRATVKVTPNGAALGRIAMLLPNELSRRLQTETEAHGVATLSGPHFDNLAQLVIESADFGIQVAKLQLDSSDDTAQPKKMPDTIRLRPVGHVFGTIVSPHAKDAQGIPLKLTSSLGATAGQPPPAVIMMGRAEAVSDVQGRFDIPAIAEGALSFIDVSNRAASSLRLRLPRIKAVKAKENTEIEIPLAVGVLATGVVIERASKHPVPGMTIHVWRGFDIEEALTDEDGRFHCLVPPGRVVALPLTTSAYSPLTRGKLGMLAAEVPDTTGSFELPTIELVLLRDVIGAVVDEAGNVVSGAKVRARCEAFDRRLDQLSPRLVELIAADGTFTVAAVNPECDLLLEARTDDAFGRIRIPASSFDGKAVRLQVRSADLIAIAGRVMNTSGKPAADVPVELWLMSHVPEGNVDAFERVTFDGGTELRTDAEGRFTTPRELDRESTYQARVALPGGEPAATPAFNASLANSTQLPDLIVRRTTTLAGRVEDRQGRPVPEALVFQAGDAWQRVQATTDAQGRFRLPQVMADPTFVFVRKGGYRFLGQQIKADESALVSRLIATDEPAEPLMTLPPALPRDERLALARRLLEPCLAKLDLNNEREGPRVFEAWADVDPADMLRRLDETPPRSSFVAAYLRRAVALALAADDADEALAVVETIADASFRSMSYIDVADALPEVQRQRKLELLGQASVVVRQIGEPAMKAIQLGQTAERFLNLGERDEAEKLLREGEKLAQQLPVDAFGGYARGAFAEELGQIDLPAALALMKGLTDVSEFDRHHGNLAHELAALQPSEAERLLGMLHTAKEDRRIADPSGLWGVRVCYRMAPVDLPRARTIADRISDPYLKARAYGLMAQAIARQKPREATELLAQAFDVLQALVDARQSRGPGAAGKPATHDSFNGLYSAASLAGALLPAVEAVDPRLVREHLWRAVSFRLPRVGNETQRQLADPANAALAMMLARYDRAVAEAILRPIEARLVRFHSRDAALGAFVLIAPRRAVEAVERFDPEQADPLMRAQLASLLTLEGDALWRKLLGNAALWSIDVEDF